MNWGVWGGGGGDCRPTSNGLGNPSSYDHMGIWDRGWRGKDKEMSIHNRRMRSSVEGIMIIHLL